MAFFKYDTLDLKGPTFRPYSDFSEATMTLFSATFLRHRSTDRKIAWTMQLCRTHGWHREGRTKSLSTEVEWQLPKTYIGHCGTYVVKSKTGSYGLTLSVSIKITGKSEDTKFSRWHLYIMRLNEWLSGWAYLLSTLTWPWILWSN